MATRAGTWAYRDAHDGFARTYFRRFGDGVVSSIGLGTYLGEATSAVDERYRDTVERALSRGVNLLDTAINYRHQRSERLVGDVLREHEVDREAVVVATKGGFVPFDWSRPDDPGAFVRERYVETGIVDPDDVVRGNCITPAFVEDSLDRSLGNLGLETIDCYYVHNPETQLERFDHGTVYDRLEETFTLLERRAAAGDIRYYGVASWECFRVPTDHPRFLSLPEVVRRARAASDAAGTTATHLRAIQLPFNVHMADAFTVAAHESGAGPKSALRFAHDAGLDVFTSASVMQGELTAAGAIPAPVDARLEGESTVQRAINFARSAPGVTAALVGTTSTAHLDENVAAGTFTPMGARAFDETFE